MSKKKDSREAVRVPLDLTVGHGEDGNYFFDVAQNLSKGGVFIKTEKPLPVGSSIDVSFTVPRSRKKIVVKGSVMWCQEAVKGRANVIAGMGVQFLDFEGKSKESLEDYLKSKGLTK